MWREPAQTVLVGVAVGGFGVLDGVAVGGTGVFEGVLVVVGGIGVFVGVLVGFPLLQKATKLKP
jgi:hypothetical protein